jgi:hypothetical protein
MYHRGLVADGKLPIFRDVVLKLCLPSGEVVKNKSQVPPGSPVEIHFTHHPEGELLDMEGNKMEVPATFDWSSEVPDISHLDLSLDLD